MGRYVTPSLTASQLTNDFAIGNTTYDADDFVSAMVSNDITYSNVTYEDDEGANSTYGGVFKRVTGWTETNNTNNSSQTVTVTYAGDGTVSTVTVA